jgi:DNA-binding LacI/PurR family transcriptional regulator
MSVNVSQVATRANVSIASVSRVLNNQGGVSEELRRKIRAILEDGGNYSTHVSERGVKLAVIIEMDKPHVSTYISTLLTGIADYALHNNVDLSTVFVQSSDKAKMDYLRVLRERHCDGVIPLFSSTLNPQQTAGLIAARMAVMVLNGRCDHEQGGHLYVDPTAGMTLLLNHLSELGHRDIAFLAGPQEGDYDNSQRVAVFMGHLKNAGGKRLKPHLVEHQPTRLAQEAGYLQAASILKRSPQVTALIANNDEMAYGAMLACHEAGRRVPTDISVVGFDDYPGSQFTVPPLTTIRLHLSEVGYQSVKAINEYICGTLKTLPRKVLKPELIVRGSTAAAGR